MKGFAEYLKQDMEEAEMSAVAGELVEVTLIDAGFTNDADKYVTEVQVPVLGRQSYSGQIC